MTPKGNTVSLRKTSPPSPPARRRWPIAVGAAGAAALLAAATVLLSLPASADTTRYEAEIAPATCAGTIDSNHSGFSGSGFCTSTNAAGAAAQFTVSGGGAATLGVRYANGTTTNRAASLVVNGTTVQSLASPS